MEHLSISEKFSEPLLTDSEIQDPINTKQIRTTSPTFIPTLVDIFLSTVMVISFPVGFRFIQSRCGALIPLLVYYLVGCIGIPMARRGFSNLGYALPVRISDFNATYTSFFPHWYQFGCFVFLPFLVLETIKVYISWNLIIPADAPLSSAGVLVTIFVWCPLNSCCEQMCWMYICDSFWNRAHAHAQTGDLHQRKRCCNVRTVWIGTGILMCLAFVGMIHAIFWTRFLMEFKQGSGPLFPLFFSLKIIDILGYIALWKTSNSMYPLFFLHIISDVTSVVAGRYDIVPHLWTA